LDLKNEVCPCKILSYHSGAYFYILHIVYLHIQKFSKRFLKMEAVSFSETLLPIFRFVRCPIVSVFLLRSVSCRPFGPLYARSDFVPQENQQKVLQPLLGAIPVKIMIDQKQLDSVESFKYLGSNLTNDGRCTCEIKCRIAMAEAAFNKKRTLFASTLDLELRNKLVKCYIWSITLYGAENLDASGRRSEARGKF
jgi:hypothetical protein